MDCIKQFGKYIQIRGNNSWKLLKNVPIEHKIVDVKDCTIYDGISGPSSFSNATDVYFRNCTGNMAYFYLSPDMFPKARRIFLDTHFEPTVYQRFDRSVYLYITERTLKGRPYYHRIRDHPYDYIEFGKRTYLFIVPDDHMKDRFLEIPFYDGNPKQSIE